MEFLSIALGYNGRSVLAAIFILGIATMWAPARWVLTGFEAALLALGVWRLREFSGSAWALVAILMWGAVQIAAGWTVDIFRTQESMLNMLLNLTAFSLAFDCTRGERERFLTSMVLFATVLSVFAMATAYTSPAGVIAWTVDLGTSQPTLGPFVYRNQYAAFVEALLPVALFRACVDRERAWLWAGASGLLFASVVAAGSRAGAVLCLAEVVLVPGLVGRGIAPVAVATAGLTLAAGWQFLWARFQEPFGIRGDLLLSTFAMWRERPWTGWGLGTWSQVYPGFARYDDGTFVNQAHSDWAQWAAEGGVAVLGAMLFVAVRLVAPAWRSVWALGAIAVLAHCAVDYPMQQRPALAAFFFAIFGLASRRAAR